MPSDKHSSITAQATGLIFSLFKLQPERCLLVYCSTYNAFFMDLLMSSFVFHLFLLTEKTVNLVFGLDGLPCIPPPAPDGVYWTLQGLT